MKPILTQVQNFDNMIDLRRTDEKLQGERLFFDGYGFVHYTGDIGRTSANNLAVSIQPITHQTSSSTLPQTSKQK